VGIIDLIARKVILIVGVTILVFVLPFSSAPALGLDRTNGEFWTYDLSTTMDIVGVQSNLTGAVTYTFEDVRALTVGGADYATNLMSIDGSLTGPLELYGHVVGNADVSLSGLQYEDRASAGIVKDDVTMVGTASFGTGIFSLTYNLRVQEVVTTTPPILSEFDPLSIKLGDSWSKTINVTTTTSIWENGTLANTTTVSRSVTYDAVVASSTESIETPAGVFEASRVTVTDTGGNSDTFWWSSAVGNFVKHEVHENGTDTPSLAMVLTGHGTKSSELGLVVAIVGVIVLAIAVVVLLVVIMLRRRPQAPQPAFYASPGPVDSESKEDNANFDR